jgi:hypothetical protein
LLHGRGLLVEDNHGGLVRSGGIDAEESENVSNHVSMSPF